MVYKIRIRRQESQKADSYWQEFEYDGSKNSSVATVLKELNSRTPLKDNSGNIVTPISWEWSCMVRKCGACAMLIKRIKSFLGVDGGDLYDTDRFIDIKLSCREQMLQKLIVYDPAKGAEYATYIFPFIRDAMLRFRMGEEKWSVSSLTNYKMVRSMAWLYHNTKDAVNEFSKKYNCDLALAEEYLKVVRGIRNQQPFYVTDEDGEETGEDVALDDTWNYTDILWNGIQAEKVQRAFEKLNYREQTLLEKRLAICMTCGRVGSWKERPTFEELAVMFEGSTASGAERAYRKAVDKLTELLVAEGAIHAVQLKQKSKTRHKKKVSAAIYEYQVDCDGEWGEISLDFENGTAEIIRLADWDTMKTNRFANKVIAYLLGSVKSYAQNCLRLW